MAFCQNIFNFGQFEGLGGSSLNLICSYARAFHKDFVSGLGMDYVGNSQNTADLSDLDGKESCLDSILKIVSIIRHLRIPMDICNTTWRERLY